LKDISTGGFDVGTSIDGTILRWVIDAMSCRNYRGRVDESSTAVVVEIAISSVCLQADNEWIRLWTLDNGSANYTAIEKVSTV